jgi:hypothetical protein
MKHLYYDFKGEHNVIDLINALPRNSYGTTVQRATIEEVVFSMSSAPNNSRNGALCDQFARLRNGSYNRTVFSVWSVP